MIDTRRNETFSFSDKQGGYGGGGKKKAVGSARSAIKQRKRMAQVSERSEPAAPLVVTD